MVTENSLFRTQREHGLPDHGTEPIRDRNAEDVGYRMQLRWNPTQLAARLARSRGADSISI